MKHVQYNREPINGKFRLPEPMNMPILSANPTIISHPLHPNDSFLIFASDGLWEHLSNEKAVDIVHSYPHAVRFCPLSPFFFPPPIILVCTKVESLLVHLLILSV